MKKLLLVLFVFVLMCNMAIAAPSPVKSPNVRYILKLELKQSHFTFDLGKHLKDAMNKVEFEIPVDKKYYDAVDVNDEILDKFRGGSFWVEGSVGNWKVVVIDKRITANWEN